MTESPVLTKGPRPKPLPLLTLNAGVDDHGQVDSRIPVRWCVNPTLIEEIKAQGFKNPHLLLVVRTKRTDGVADFTYNEDIDTAHIVTPITRELTYVSFSRPGQNEIIPVVIDVRDAAEAKLVNRLRRGKHIDRSVIGYDGEFYYSGRVDDERVTLKSLKTNFTLAVEVPKEFFAPEPSDKAKAFVNRFFGGKGTDQCGFRKRFIFSCLAVVPFVVFGTIAKIVLILGAMLFTKREYDFKQLLHPFNGEVLGVIDTRDNTLFWWQEKNGYKRNPLFFVFNHFGLFLLPAIVFSIMHTLEHHGNSKRQYQLSYWGWWKTFLVVDGFYVGAFVAGAVLVGAFMGLVYIGDNLTGSTWFSQVGNRRKDRQRAAQQTTDARRAAEILRELNAMVCTTDGPIKAPSLKDLPKNKLTVSLVFNGAKTAVCRPFAK